MAVERNENITTRALYDNISVTYYLLVRQKCPCLVGKISVSNFNQNKELLCDAKNIAITFTSNTRTCL